MDHDGDDGHLVPFPADDTARAPYPHRVPLRRALRRRDVRGRDDRDDAGARLARLQPRQRALVRGRHERPELGRVQPRESNAFASRFSRRGDGSHVVERLRDLLAVGELRERGVRGWRVGDEYRLGRRGPRDALGPARARLAPRRRASLQVLAKRSDRRDLDRSGHLPRGGFLGGECLELGGRGGGLDARLLRRRALQAAALHLIPEPSLALAQLLVTFVGRDGETRGGSAICLCLIRGARGTGRGGAGVGRRRGRAWTAGRGVRARTSSAGAPPPPASGSSDMFARRRWRVCSSEAFRTVSFIGPGPKSQQLVHLLTFQRVHRDRAARAEGFNGTAP